MSKPNIMPPLEKRHSISFWSDSKDLKSNPSKSSRFYKSDTSLSSVFLLDPVKTPTSNCHLNISYQHINETDSEISESETQNRLYYDIKSATLCKNFKITPQSVENKQNHTNFKNNNTQDTNITHTLPHNFKTKNLMSYGTNPDKQNSTLPNNNFHKILKSKPSGIINTTTSSHQQPTFKFYKSNQNFCFSMPLTAKNSNTPASRLTSANSIQEAPVSHLENNHHHHQNYNKKFPSNPQKEKSEKSIGKKSASSKKDKKNLYKTTKSVLNSENHTPVESQELVLQKKTLHKNHLQHEQEKLDPENLNTEPESNQLKTSASSHNFSSSTVVKTKSVKQSITRQEKSDYHSHKNSKNSKNNISKSKKDNSLVSNKPNSRQTTTSLTGTVADSGISGVTQPQQSKISQSITRQQKTHQQELINSRSNTQNFNSQSTQSNLHQSAKNNESEKLTRFDLDYFNVTSEIDEKDTAHKNYISKQLLKRRFLEMNINLTLTHISIHIHSTHILLQNYSQMLKIDIRIQKIYNKKTRHNNTRKITYEYKMRDNSMKFVQPGNVLKLIV